MSQLSGEWWAAKPRGLLKEAVRKAASQLRVRTQAPEGMEEFQEDPIGFCVEVLGIPRNTIVWSENPGYEDHKWDGTPDPIATWLRALADGMDVAVESATGQGKSFTLALTKLWFLACWTGSRCFDFAEKVDQLKDYSWTELAKIFPRFKVRFPSAHLSTPALQLRMDGEIREGEAAGWGAAGRGYQVGQEQEISGGGQGMHARHMLLSVEEAANVPLALTRALAFTVGGAHNIRQMVGNPNDQDDALHSFASEAGVVSIRISALDHPNVVANAARDPEWEDVRHDIEIVPGASGRKWVRWMQDQYPREHWMYQSRVRGISPPQHQHSLIRQSWLDRAADRWKERQLRFGFRSLGVDVARSTDGDYGAIADGIGAHLDEVERFPCPNPVQLGLRIAAMMQTGEIFERYVAVDVGGGYGGGTVDKLKELEMYVYEFNGGAGAVPRLDETLLQDEDQPVREVVLHRNLRSQAYWRLAMDLQLDRVALPPDPVLHEELRAVRWEPRLGKIVVEEKDKVTERLGRSPDAADATVMWNWVRERVFPEDEEELRAWSQEALEYEATEGRRVRDKPAPRADDVSPTIIERLP